MNIAIALRVRAVCSALLRSREAIGASSTHSLFAWPEELPAGNANPQRIASYLGKYAPDARQLLWVSETKAPAALPGSSRSDQTSTEQSAMKQSSKTAWEAIRTPQTFLLILAIAITLPTLGQTPTPAAEHASTATPAGNPGATPPGGDLATQANDPTAALKQLQFLNSYNGSYYGTRGEGNDFSLRPVLPGGIKGIHTITRPTFSLQSTPNGRTGLGDTILLTVAIFEVAPGLKFGAGPILIAPTATNGIAGQGKWQLGPSVVVIDARHNGLILGLLEQNPVSFAGESKRPDVNQSLLQPVIVQKLQHSFFVRIDPTLTFDWTRGGAATIPVNAGFGRIFKIGNRPINAYIQPEWNVHRPNYVGAAAPQFTMRGSLTLLFPKKQEPSK